MKQYRRRIENLERTIDETIRVIVKRDTELEKVLVMRRNEPPHQTYTRKAGEDAGVFLLRAGCSTVFTAKTISHSGK